MYVFIYECLFWKIKGQKSVELCIGYMVTFEQRICYVFGCRNFLDVTSDVFLT